ncbi:hypothetical protein SAY86_006850 [Trapa natans]|uniref:Tetratricopeptide repeat protein n=1 Tax=Trapa natans TaxID=22666 RepID=A0AAN7L491_TRANT|nr:hypothetical protein SAY86_006850 [Trapa natans]
MRPWQCMIGQYRFFRRMRPSGLTNQSAALMALGRLREAERECEEALRLNPSYELARQRLFSLDLRLGQVEDARLYANYVWQDPMELQKLQLIEKLLKSCPKDWRLEDWKTAVREVIGLIWPWMTLLCIVSIL